MRVCGVEMKGSEAILCLLAIDSGLFDIPDCRTVRLPLLKDSGQRADEEISVCICQAGRRLQN